MTDQQRPNRRGDVDRGSDFSLVLYRFVQYLYPSKQLISEKNAQVPTHADILQKRPDPQKSTMTMSEPLLLVRFF